MQLLINQNKEGKIMKKIKVDTISVGHDDITTFKKILKENIEFTYRQDIIDIFDEMQEKGCPECGRHNLKLITKDYVDFYRDPVAAICDCGWEKEIVIESELFFYPWSL